MISSDSQAMGRVGEIITRTWQTAHKMKVQRGQLPSPSGRGAGGEGDRADNFRTRHYVAKYTINPAISHGIAHEVGSRPKCCRSRSGIFCFEVAEVVRGTESRFGDGSPDDSCLAGLCCPKYSPNQAP